MVNEVENNRIGSESMSSQQCFFHKLLKYAMRFISVLMLLTLGFFQGCKKKHPERPPKKMPLPESKTLLDCKSGIVRVYAYPNKPVKLSGPAFCSIEIFYMISDNALDYIINAKDDITYDELTQKFMGEPASYFVYSTATILENKKIKISSLLNAKIKSPICLFKVASDSVSVEMANIKWKKWSEFKERSNHYDFETDWSSIMLFSPRKYTYTKFRPINYDGYILDAYLCNVLSLNNHEKLYEVYAAKGIGPLFLMYVGKRGIAILSDNDKYARNTFMPAKALTYRLVYYRDPLNKFIYNNDKFFDGEFDIFTIDRCNEKPGQETSNTGGAKMFSGAENGEDDEERRE